MLTITIDSPMPKKCDECRFRHLGLSWCTVAQKSTSHTNTGKPINQNERPKWCPIKETPA